MLVENAEARTRGQGVKESMQMVLLHIGRALSPAAGLRVPPIFTIRIVLMS
jgi:hypothetical protein